MHNVKKCEVPSHENKWLHFICIEDTCKKKRSLCSACISGNDHKGHLTT